MQSRPAFTVIVPARNARDTLAACLRALIASTVRPAEIVVYDDNSTDETGEIARACGARVITNPSRHVGPGLGRNRAAKTVETEFVAFVDADVEVHPEALGRLLDSVAATTDTVAAFGSYDDAPHCRRLAARYVNLRHHFVHQRSSAEATTFWSGLGMVRREAFLNVGGFDRAFDRPSIEDVELGLRLVQAGGSIRLVRDAQAKHWKDWRLVELWKTDILRRALPWSLLLVRGDARTGTLNLSARERVSAVLAHVALLSLGAGLLQWQAAVAGVVALVAYAVVNGRFLRLLWRSGGVRLLSAGFGLHLAYHLYSSATFAFVRLRHAFGSLQSDRPAASAEIREADR